MHDSGNQLVVQAVERHCRKADGERHRSALHSCNLRMCVPAQSNPVARGFPNGIGDNEAVRGFTELKFGPHLQLACIPLAWRDAPEEVARNDDRERVAQRLGFEIGCRQCALVSRSMAEMRLPAMLIPMKKTKLTM